MTFEEAVLAEQKKQLDLMVAKQRDYGHNNILDFGEYGVLVRTNDKIARLKNLQKRGIEPSNESVQDSWIDIANYATIMMMLNSGTFTSQLSEDI